MLLNFLFTILEYLLNLVDIILPDYDLLPLPDAFFTFLNSFISFIVEMANTPVLRIFAGYLTGFFFVLIAILFIANRGLDIINFFRGSGKLKG